MANSQQFTYTFNLDAKSVEASAKKLKDIYNLQLKEVKVPLGDQSTSGISKFAQAFLAAEQKIIQAVTFSNAKILGITKNADAARIGAGQAAAEQLIEQEKKITAATETESKKRQAANEQEAKAKKSGPRELLPGYEAITGLLSYSVAGVAVGALVSKGVEEAINMEKRATAYLRVEKAASSLAGSMGQLNSLMKTYDQATGGIIPKEQQMRNLTQLLALGYADTNEELEKYVKAVRGISIATGQTQDLVSSTLTMAIANQSIQRLDNIGLSADEVKKRITALKNENKGLSDSAAYQQAILGVANEKFGDLVNSSEAAATGIEKLTKAWADMRTEMDERDKGFIDQAAADLARMIDPQLSDYQQRLEKRQAQTLPGASFLMPANVAMTNDLVTRLREINEAEKNGITVNQDYRDAIENAASEQLNFGFVTNRTAQILALEEAGIGHTIEAVQSMEEAVAAQTAAQVASEQAKRDDAAATQELAEKNMAAGGELGMLTSLAYKSGMGMAEFNERLKEVSGGLQRVKDDAAGLNSVLQGIGAGVASAAGELSTVVGPVEAIAAGRAAVAKLEALETDYRRKNPGPIDAVTLGVLRRQWETEVIDPLKQPVDDHTQAMQDADSAAKRAASEQESASKKAAQELENAAKKMASDFEDSLHKVEGLFTPSEVTDLDMQLAKAGMYQPKADEWLRQFRDEVAQGKDLYPGIDIKQVAGIAGLPQDADPKLLIQMIEKMVRDLSFYANPAATALVNQDAVPRELMHQRQIALGSANLSNIEGLNPAVVQAAGYQGILPGRLGGPVTLPGVAAGMMAEGGAQMSPQEWAQTATDAVQPLTDGLVAAIATMGGTAGTKLADAMFKAFNDQALTLPWIDKLSQVITDQVGRSILSDLNNNATSDMATAEGIGSEQ